MEDSGKKCVEGAGSGSAILKLYNKWHEKLMESSEEECGGGRLTSGSSGKKGLLSKVKPKQGKRLVSQ